MLEARLAGTKPPADRGATIAVRELLQRRVPSLPKKEKIAVRHLNFYYQNGNQALKDISMPIYAQSVTALFGPSGCGKSTLIRVFNRIYAAPKAKFCSTKGFDRRSALLSSTFHSK